MNIFVLSGKRFVAILLLLVASATAEAQSAVPVYNLASYEERVLEKNDTLYIVNFWATWCKPCIEELPYFDSLRTEWKDKPVHFIWVSQDAVSRSRQVAQFMAKNNYGAEVFILSAGNPNVWIDKIEPAWSGTIPATLLYKNGQKLNFHEGDFAGKNELETFLNSKQ